MWRAHIGGNKGEESNGLKQLKVEGATPHVGLICMTAEWFKPEDSSPVTINFGRDK